MAADCHRTLLRQRALFGRNKKIRAPADLLAAYLEPSIPRDDPTLGRFDP
jgi:hypothetical protein